MINEPVTNEGITLDNDIELIEKDIVIHVGVINDPILDELKKKAKQLEEGL